MITIAIPTYNRREAVVNSIEKCISFPVDFPFKILVVDNCSDDGTFNELVSRFSDLDYFRVIRNHQNLGFYGNIIKIFDLVDTEYVIFCSDEDYICSNELDYLQIFLQEYKPFLVSTQVYLQDTDSDLYQGNEVIEKIPYKEVRVSTNYMSGVVMRVEECKANAKYLDAHKKNNFVFLYPVPAMSLILAVNGDSYWYNKVLTRKSFSLKTSIVDISGDDYTSIKARVKQNLGQLVFLCSIVDVYEFKKSVKVVGYIVNMVFGLFKSLLRHVLKGFKSFK